VPQAPWLAPMAAEYTGEPLELITLNDAPLDAADGDIK
jgi:hypothetical protein